LTESEVADLLRVSGRTIRRWGERGVLPIVQLGGIRRYPSAAIDALVGGIAPTTSEAPAGQPTPREATAGLGRDACER